MALISLPPCIFFTGTTYRDTYSVSLSVDVCKRNPRNTKVFLITLITNGEHVVATNIIVHRCGASGSMRACHAAGPGSIPGRYKFPR